MTGSRLRSAASRVAPLLAVGGSCVVSLILLRPELTQVPYLNDEAMHSEMVRFALAKIRSGHLPLDSWFPYLNLGSPQFLHYQSLGAMVTALLAWPLGVARVFPVVTWFLVCCWPACIYGAARVFGIRRGAAAAAAMLSPFISSFTGVGYEQISYLWGGFGLWSQLWAMWTLPFAWALSWRAVDERRFVVPAAVLVAATAAFHFQTGYLAFAGLVVFVLARPSGFVRRVGRAGLVAGGALALAAWVIVPLVAQDKWAAVNQFLQSGRAGVDANSYGARRALGALVGGNLLDWHHLPLLTPLLALGLALCVIAWRDPDGPGPVGQGASRALVLLFVLSVLLFFGRPTLGPLLHLVPAARDLFLRRFIAGVQLAGLLLAGVGGARLATWIIAGARRVVHRRGDAGGRVGIVLGGGAVACLALAALVPAWSFSVSRADRERSFISAQSAAAPAAAKLDALIATIKREGGGRTFAGGPSGFGATFMVGEVAVYKYLAAKDVDEVGFTLRTASLMSDPEATFDEYVPGDYAAFGVRWLILPAGTRPPVPARLVERRGEYALWKIAGDRYVQVVDTRGTVSANSADLASFARTFLAGLPSTVPIYPTVAYQGGPATPGTLPLGARPAGSPGRVLSEHADLAAGTVVARVSASRTAVVLLSASYDPGWQATVDGRAVPTEMVAPALVGVRVGAGVHTVHFVYRGFPDYPQLFAVGVAGFVSLLAVERRRRSGQKVAASDVGPAMRG